MRLLAEGGIPYYVWGTRTINSNVYEPGTGSVLACDLDVQEATSFVHTGDDALIPGPNAECRHVIGDGKHSELLVIVGEPVDRPLFVGGPGPAYIIYGRSLLHHATILTRFGVGRSEVRMVGPWL